MDSFQLHGSVLSFLCFISIAAASSSDGGVEMHKGEWPYIVAYALPTQVWSYTVVICIWRSTKHAVVTPASRGVGMWEIKELRIGSTSAWEKWNLFR